MFSKFNVKGISLENIGEYEEAGRQLYNQHKAEIDESLKSFINENGVIDGVIDGDKLRNSWFPMEESFDIFLSHSHDDERTAIALAGFLHKELHLNTFIDSCLWGDINRLLKKIDARYCIHKDGESFDYDKRNYSTSHVHMMLSIALSDMIDRCESIFLLNTPHSISLKENIEKKQTSSPWIYNELAMANIVRVCPIENYREKYRTLRHSGVVYECLNENADLHIEYDVGHILKKFVALDLKDLKSCAKEWKDNQMCYSNAMDYIYSMKGIIRSAY